MGALSESFKYGNLSTTYVTKHSEMGDSRKYPYCIPQAAFWSFEGKECSLG